MFLCFRQDMMHGLSGMNRLWSLIFKVWLIMPKNLPAGNNENATLKHHKFLAAPNIDPRIKYWKSCSGRSRIMPVSLTTINHLKLGG
jgi:hypothetical protein